MWIYPLPVLTISVSGSGTTDPSPGSHSYTYGASATVTATPSLHYRFDHWSLNGGYFTMNPISPQMTADYALTAYFTAIPQETLTINSDSHGTTNPAAGTHTYDNGTQANVTATASEGYTFSHWVLNGTNSYDNPIAVQMIANYVLTPYFHEENPGGCPYVYDCNGTGFVKDNNILPASEDGNGTDTKDYYLLQQPLVPVSRKQGCVYSLQIGEFENNVDYIDQVQLTAVDHSQDTSVAVTQHGEIITYRKPASPKWCVDGSGNSELEAIGTINGNISDASTYFMGNSGDWLMLDFGAVSGPTANLILRDDMLCDKTCLDVQVQDANGVWQTVETLIPRAFWSVEAVNMTAYLPSTGDFIVRLLFTATHRIDFIGLDTSRQTPITVRTASPALASHSTMGNVTSKLLQDDENCVELVSGQQITLTFTLPKERHDATRDFILYANGYYYTIT